MVLTGKHTLTRESQEVMVGLISLTNVPASEKIIVCTSTPHSGQLNITTSTLLTPLKSGVALKSKVMVVPRAVVCSVSS